MPWYSLPMNSYPFVDAFVTVGQRYELPLDDPRSTADTIARSMSRCGISAAFVTHTAARDFDAMGGNSMLLEEVAGREEFRPIATVVPGAFLGDGGTDDAEALRGYLTKHRFCGAAINPLATNHNYSVSDWCSGVLLSVLESMRMPLFVEFSEIGGDVLAYLLAAHPKLPVVVCRIFYGSDRVLFPLLDRHANLYVLTTIDRQYRSLEEYTARFGAARLVFGSCYPGSSMGASVASILMSGLDESEKRQIASGTIEGLQGSIVYGE